MLEQAHAVVEAGAQALVLECVPASLAKDITAAIPIPTIGIGAGVDCDGQILVSYDLLGITPGKRIRFTKDFLIETGSVAAAPTNFCVSCHSYAAVKLDCFECHASKP